MKMHGFRLATAFAAAITLPLVLAQSLSLPDIPTCAAGVTLDVPAIAAKAVSSSAAAPAQAASSVPTPSPSPSSGSPTQDTQDDDMPTTAAAASSADPMSSAPVSPDAFPTSVPASLDTDDDEDDDAKTIVATTGGEALPSSTTPAPTSINSDGDGGVVYDTGSTVPSATIASDPASADASLLDAQVPTSTSAYLNSSSTDNSTDAASSPISYVGAAIKEKVRGGMLLLVVLGMFWEL
ncbi:MAG: hypothetical protein Q9168_001433 [Polycauliona sp. 1 TL-2023]